MVVVETARNYELVVVLNPETTEDEIAEGDQGRGRHDRRERRAPSPSMKAGDSSASPSPYGKFNEGNYVLTRFTS